jgi:hypothetical protein
VTPLSAVGNGKIVTLAGLGTPEKPIRCRRLMWRNRCRNAATVSTAGS